VDSKACQATNAEGDPKSATLLCKSATMLCLACQQGEDHVARNLLDELGADVNQVGKLGATPLHTACVHGQMDTVRMLVDEYGAAVAQVDRHGCTPLFRACENNRLDIARFLGEKIGPVLGSLPGNDGRTPLYVACQKGHKDIARYLIHDLGVDKWTPNTHLLSSMGVAAQENHMSIVRMFADGHFFDLHGPKPAMRRDRRVTVVELVLLVVTFVLMFLINQMIPSTTLNEDFRGNAFIAGVPVRKTFSSPWPRHDVATTHADDQC
jgi:hypothetical protein